MNEDVLKGKEYANQDKWNIAAMFFEKAPYDGNLDGCYELALCYFYGYGKDQDFTKAFHYANLATASRQPESLYLLARCYVCRKDGYASKEFAKVLFKI